MTKKVKKYREPKTREECVEWLRHEVYVNEFNATHYHEKNGNLELAEAHRSVARIMDRIAGFLEAES